MYQLIISGNLTRDAEKRTTPSGKSVINFTIAVNYGSKEEPKTEFIECGVWGKRGESEKLAAALTKGTKLIVTGQPRVRAYVPDGGDPKGVIGLFVNDLEFCGGGGGGTGNGANGASNAPSGSAPEDDDFPF